MDVNDFLTEDGPREKEMPLFRLHCLTIDHDVVVGPSAIRQLVNTSAGPVAYVKCFCGAEAILESGAHTWHGPARTSRVA